METLEQLYCAREPCRPIRFRRRLFWRTLYPHARLLAPFLGGFAGRYFGTDRELVNFAAAATSMRQIQEEIFDYLDDASSRGWLHRRANVRISTHRLKHFARRFLPDAVPPATPAPPAPDLPHAPGHPLRSSG